MKPAIKRLATFYLETWWLPALLFGAFAFIAILMRHANRLCEIDAELLAPPRLAWLPPLLPNDLFIKGAAILFGVCFFAALIRHLLQRRWLKAVGGCAILFGFCGLLCVAACAMVFVVFPPLMGLLQSIEQSQPPTSEHTP